MDILSTQIIAAIKKIRTQKGRPDSDKIFKEVVKELSTNITLEDIQQVLQHMISDDKLINTQYKGLNSYYVVSGVWRILVVKISIFRRILLQLSLIPFFSVIISVENPKIDSTKYKRSSRDSSQVSLEQVVAMKAYFMKKIHELKNEICCLKNQLENEGKNSDGISILIFNKSEISLLKDQNSFLKSELEQK